MAGTERKEYTYTPFTYDEYKTSTEVNNAAEKKRKAESAVNGYGHYIESQNVIDALGLKTNAENALKAFNEKGFSYDINADALYQQYKDKYIQQGKMAMADTMGQAAAMTGGYGNSYAASVGNQAYQASLQNLNDIIPQLYQMAYDMWGDKRNMLLTDRDYYSSNYNDVFNKDYGMWNDKYNRLVTDRDYYGNAYDSAFNRDYGMYSADRELAHGEHTTTEGYKYQNVADANAFAQWQAGQDLAEEQLELQKAQIGASKNSNGTYTVPASSPTLTAEEYNEVLQNAAIYADKTSGGGETALANYLNGLVARGLSEDEAAAIYEQYFPTKIPEISKGSGRPGGSRGIVQVVN